LAVTERAWIIDTVHVFDVPLQAPDHPTNVAPDHGLAVSVTKVFDRYHSLQSEPHEMPAGDEVTAPFLVPDLYTVNWFDLSANVAVTYRAWVIETVHVGYVPLHAPDHLTNFEPVNGVAVSLTDVPYR
jgi:hypothetical protein